MKLKKILAEKPKSHVIYSIKATDTLKDAVKKLVEHNVGCLLVTDPGNPDKYVGIIAQTDIIRKCAEDGNFYDIKAEDVMVKQLVVATGEDEVEYIVKVMKRHKIHHIPVIEKGKLCGIISITDIIGSMHEEDEIKIRYLSDYMGGTYGSNVY
ncbi:MAG: CBS domain-containing protein [Victivallales bacterium]